MQTVTLSGLLQIVLALGLMIFVALKLAAAITSGKPRRLLKLVDGRWIWVNGYGSDVEFIYDPRDPAGQLQPEDIQRLEREDAPPSEVN